MKLPPSIKKMSHGLACYIKKDNVIYMNKHLDKYPRLHNRVLGHELEHALGRGIGADLEIKSDWELFRFMLRHPSSFTSYIPLWFKPFTYNPVMGLLWLFAGAVFYLTFRVGYEIVGCTG